MSTAATDVTTVVDPAITSRLAHWVSGLQSSDLSAQARTWAQHALLDWVGVTIAGTREPLVDILVDELADGNTGSCSIIGRQGAKASLLDAALINGTASHALDYDDVNRRLHGHPTVTVTPVALALGEHLNASGQDILTGIIAGTEVSCLIGEMAGDGHYEAGFHATATIGTFGATATAATLLKLDATQTRHAFGIAASQLSGLKANFGTMTKPLHAGKAAANGLLAARLAARGFTANDNIIECTGGSAQVMMPGFTAGYAEPHPAGYFSIQQTLFKYHAACYLTHSTIEAVAQLRDAHNLTLDDLKTMTLKVRPSHFSVCNIPDPQTGLEIKFSIRQCAVLALAGVDTAALETYSDANALDARFAQARAKTVAQGTDIDDRMAATVCIELNNGKRLEQSANVGIPAADLDQQWLRLQAKFNSLCVPHLGEQRSQEIVDTVNTINSAQNIHHLIGLVH